MESGSEEVGRWLTDPEPPFRFRSNEGQLFGVMLPLSSRNRLSAFRPKRSFARHSKYVRYELLTGRLRIRPSTFELTGTQRHAAARPVERGVIFPMLPLEQGKLPGWRGALHPGRQLEFCQFFGPGQ